MSYTPIPVHLSTGWWCESQHCVVEHRGAGMGKVYVHADDDPPTRDGNIEAIFTWTAPTKKGHSPSIRPEGVCDPTRDAKSRAVRALAMSPWGEMCFGYRMEETADPPKPEKEPVPDQPDASFDAILATTKKTVDRWEKSYDMKVTLQDLRERLEKADKTLMDMAELEGNTSPERRNHCRSKAEGVRLALSYLMEAGR